MTPKILFFNGPPRCGKDTAALFTMNRFSSRMGRYEVADIRFDRFAMPIKYAFASTVSAPTIDRFGNVYPYEETKDEVIPWLSVSYRQWQIDFSEKFMKPLYGKDIFARLFVNRTAALGPSTRAIVVPDSGFAEEVAPIAERFGQENIMLLRIHRPGCDFSKDSRSYLHGVVDREIDVENFGEMHDFHQKLHGIVGDFLGAG